MKKLASGLTIVALLSGCGTIIEGSSQNININTNPQANVTCEASNARGNWKLNPVPASLMVKRSQSRLNIKCYGAGYSGEYSERADAEAWTFANILWGLIGGPIGWIVDASTGAMFSYDDVINVPLTLKSPVVDQILEQKSEPMANSLMVPAPVAVQPAPATQRLLSYDELVASGAIVSPAKAPAGMPQH